MKTIVKIIFITALFTNLSYSANPAYQINVNNIINLSSNSVQFDIYLKHTNPAEADFLYSMGQILFDIDPGFANGGTLTYNYVPNGIQSDLPYGLRLRNPVVMDNQLRLAAQANANYLNGYTISSTGFGTLIGRMRLYTTASSFAGSLNLTLRNSASGGFYTKIYAFIEDDASNYKLTNITPQESPQLVLDLRYRLEAMYPVLDSIKIRVRSTVLPYLVKDSMTVFSELNGTHFKAVAGFTNLVQGDSYYIEAVHRNSISTWSKNPVTFLAGTTVYDFTPSVNLAFGSNMVNVSGVASIYSGDVNQNGFIDLSDVSKIYNDANEFVTGYVNTDLTGNEFVDLEDMSFAYNNSLQFIQIRRP